MNILLIEDEKKISEFIKKGFKEQSYNVTVADNGIQGEKMSLSNTFDLIILDVLLPDQNGWQTCMNIRNEGVLTPILMLTSMGDTEDVVKGLNIGADDYLTKPFEFKELLARSRALLRRNSKEKSSVLQIEDLVMEVDKHQVKRAEKDIHLTTKEFALLEYLLRNKRKLLSRDQISESIWGIDFQGESNVIDTYIKFLRQKIDKGFKSPLIHTVIGIGYMIREDK
ncbi:response regulator transcription factor [soil metagenome]